VFRRTLAVITLMPMNGLTGPPAMRAEAMFSAADAYERLMGKWSRELAPLLVKFARVRDGASVLDAGSGTGALTASLSAVAPATRVVGIDRARSYVAFARMCHPEDRVEFEVGDVRHLRFIDGRFDWTLSLLVLNFIPQPATALEEMIRVTRPGGTVAAAVWDYGEGMEMLRAFWDEAVALDPASDARDERHMRLCRKGELAAFWRKHRLQDVSEEMLTIRTRFSSFDHYWSPFLEKQGPAGAYLGALDPGGRRELRLRLRKRLLGDGPDRAIVLAARAWAVRGLVPSRDSSVPLRRGTHTRARMKE
jgi:SAM-dependent methyltransferase